MPKIFEIFGYPIDDNSLEAENNRRLARCPFMNSDCDGGGNRYLSQMDLSRHAELKAMFPERQKLAAGVCSIQVKPDADPWVVCPRRLLVLGREEAGVRRHQGSSETETIRWLGYVPGTKLGVWPEVRLKYTSVSDRIPTSFDYTFDYLIMPIASVSQSEIETATQQKWSQLQRILEKSGYAIAKRGSEFIVEDFPTGVPSIIEIMTSSTSGGNKKTRSTIPMAFEDAILDRVHNAPGINYRQVWARMVSQLIVKSEIALNWGGKTIWVVQDLLVDYISTSTALNMRRFLARNTSEVNILSFSYKAIAEKHTGVIELSNPQLFAGPISSTPANSTQATPSFQDILRAPICPPIEKLLASLIRRKPANQIIAP